MTLSRLHKRLDALKEVAEDKPWCWVVAEDGEDADGAASRHMANEGCIENSGGHIVWIIVDPEPWSAAA